MLIQAKKIDDFFSGEKRERGRESQLESGIRRLFLVVSQEGGGGGSAPAARKVRAKRQKKWKRILRRKDSRAFSGERGE